MSQIIDQAEELRKSAISILLAERHAIDNALASLSHDGAAQPQPKKSHKKKAPEPGAEAEPTPSEK